MFDVALSTMWAVGRFPELADFFDAGRKLGFARFELNHAITSAMLEGLSLDGTITSVHEPCPADLSMNVLKERNWLVSAPGEEDRRQGVAAIRRSIDLAHKLGVGAVIVHPGRVDIDTDLESKLASLYRAGKAGRPEYARAKERLAAARAAQAETNMRSVRRSLVELAEYAARMGVRLGLENRFHYHEIPLPEELEDLLHRSAFVLESMIYGEPDEKHDEVIAAMIVPDAEAFIEYDHRQKLSQLGRAVAPQSGVSPFFPVQVIKM